MHDQITSSHKRIDRLVMANLRASLVVLGGATRGQQVGEIIYQIRNDVYIPLLKISLILLMQHNTDRELLRA